MVVLVEGVITPLPPLVVVETHQAQHHPKETTVVKAHLLPAAQTLVLAVVVLEQPEGMLLVQLRVPEEMEVPHLFLVRL
jgi:hypothetical protein